MKIAIVVASRQDLEIIPLRADQGGELRIYSIDDDTGEALGFEAISYRQKGEDAFQQLIEAGCEAVISGVHDPEIFNVLANIGVTRFNGGGMAVTEAIKRMHQGKLNLFSHAEGERRDHDHSQCEGCGMCDEADGLRGVYLTMECQHQVEQHGIDLDDVLGAVLASAEKGNSVAAADEGWLTCRQLLPGGCLVVKYTLDNGVAQVCEASLEQG